MGSEMCIRDSYDNGTTSANKIPSSSNGSLTCDEISGSDEEDVKAILKAKDGHLWSSERDGMQCIRVKEALEALDDTTAALEALGSWDSGRLLPLEIRSAVCAPLDSMITYLSKLSDSISKLTLSGDNTESIISAQSSSDSLMKNVGCKE